MRVFLVSTPVRKLALLAALFAVVSLLSLAARGVLAAEPLYTEKSPYRDIIVYQEDGQRCMRFGRYAASRQTCISMLDRNVMVFDYAKMMMASLYLNPNPQRVLVIGLGGGTLPMALRRVLPDAQIDVIEIDPAVVRVAKRFFDFKEDARMRAYAEDGRVFVKRARSRGVKYDLVMLDAFDHEYIPEHLLTREFFLEVRSLLTERGVLAANTFSSSRLYDYESATYHSAFGEFYRLKKSNRVILLRLGGLPAPPELARNATLLEDRLKPMGVTRAAMLPLFEIERGWPADIRILTDQFSPSNLLNAR